MSAKKYRIAQIGTFDYKNYGDLLFSDILSTELSKRLSIEEIVLFSPVGGIKPFDIQNVFPLAELEKEHLRKPFDAIICGGGDILRFDAQVVRDRSKYNMTSMSADMWLYPMILGRKHHFPVLLNAPGVPSRFWGNEKELVRIALERFDYVSTRDTKSAALLNECSENAVKVTPDSIFLIGQTYSDRELDDVFARLKEELDLPERYYIFQTCALDHQLPIEAYEEKLKEIEAWLDSRCVFMPIGYVHSDTEVLEKLNQAAEQPFSMIRRELSPIEMLAVLRKSQCFVGSSMHGCLTSMVYQVPAITINSFQSTKLHGLFEMAQLPQCDVNSMREIRKELLGCVLTDERKRQIIDLVNAHFDEMARIIAQGHKDRPEMAAEDDGIHELLRLILHPDVCIPAFSKIYYRSDDDYSEGRCIVAPFSAADHQISIAIDVPLDTREIRFDPVEYSSCMVTDLVIRCPQGDALEIAACNGCRLEDTFVFSSTDPQFVVRMPEKHDGKLEIMCTILLLKEMSDLAEKLEMHFEKGANAVENMDELKQEIRETKEILLEIKETLKTYEAQAENYRKLSEELRQREEEYKDTLARCSRDVENLRAQKAERDSLMTNYRQVEAGYQQLAAEYNEIVSSASWRVTKPVRYVLDRLKAQKYTGIVIKGVKYLKAYGVRNTCIKVAQFVKQHKQQKKIREVVAYRDIAHMISHLDSLKNQDVRVYLPDVLAAYKQNKDGKRILLATHELALTGGPMAVRYFAKCLKDQGYAPMVISPSDGNLAQVFEQDGIPVVVYPGLYTNAQILHIAHLFDLVVLNTIVNAPIVSALSGTDIPVLWWIHEARASYHPGALANMPEFVPDNVCIRTGGSHAAKMLSEYRPTYRHENLLYCVPEQNERETAYQLPEQTRGKIVLATVGQLDERKGQHILAQAIRMLSESVRENCCFLFIGKKADPVTFAQVDALLAEYPNQVCHIDEVTPQELQSVYKQIDGLICSSIDDPMPIVVTQAWMHQKMVICSENTGSAAFVREYNAGYVYCNNDAGELAACIERYAANPNEHTQMKAAGRTVYDQEFSVEAFKENAIGLVEELLADAKARSAAKAEEKEAGFNGIVSIVVPTYNAGKQWEEFLRRVGAQKGVEEVELVAVDSGSRDQTVALSREFGANVIEITQEQFSHSYARNLGAENARGDIVIFMTQDALPSDENWVQKMIQPIVSGEAAAVSCKEQCPEGTELYYRVNSWGHIGFTGIRHHDQLGEGSREESVTELRPSASLNDVACAVNKRVFKRFYYRFGYGEDLDLGIRLLQNGYKVKLLSSVVVIHGHNRTAGYNLKRGYAESIAMGKMYAEWMPPKEAEQSVARKIVRGTKMLNAAFEQTRRACIGTMGKEAFFEELEKNLNHYMQAGDEELQAFPMAIDDPVLKECCAMMQPHMSSTPSGDHELIRSLVYYLDVMQIPYLDSMGVTQMTPDDQEEIYDCTIKRFCMMAGSMLARIDEEAQSFEQIQQMTHGV